MKKIDPNAPTQEQMVAFMRKRLKETGNAPTTPARGDAENPALSAPHRATPRI
jgi:hypothetical protein